MTSSHRDGCLLVSGNAFTQVGRGESGRSNSLSALVFFEENRLWANWSLWNSVLIYRKRASEHVGKPCLALWWSPWKGCPGSLGFLRWCHTSCVLASAGPGNVGAGLESEGLICSLSSSPIWGCGTVKSGYSSHSLWKRACTAREPLPFLTEQTCALIPASVIGSSQVYSVPIVP